MKQRKKMRLEEYALRVTPDAVLSVNRAGETLNAYYREKPVLDQLYRPRLVKRDKQAKAEWDAGKKLAELYAASGLDPWARAPHSDLTKPVVDGAGSAPDELSGSDSAKLELQRIEAVIGPDTYNILIAVCARGLSFAQHALEARLDRRAVKKRFWQGMEWLAGWWR